MNYCLMAILLSIMLLRDIDSIVIVKTSTTADRFIIRNAEMLFDLLVDIVDEINEVFSTEVSFLDVFWYLHFDWNLVHRLFPLFSHQCFWKFLQFTTSSKLYQRKIWKFPGSFTWISQSGIFSWCFQNLLQFMLQLQQPKKLKVYANLLENTQIHALMKEFNEGWYGNKKKIFIIHLLSLRSTLCSWKWQRVR